MLVINLILCQNLRLREISLNTTLNNNKMSLWNFLFGTSVQFTTSTIKEFAKDPEALSAISKIAASWTAGLNYDFKSNRALNFIKEDGRINEELMKEVLKQQMSDYINNDINSALSHSVNFALHGPLQNYLETYSKTIDEIVGKNNPLIVQFESTNNTSEIRTDNNGAKEIEGYSYENILSSDS